jgi:hypothetical protein
MKVVSHLQPSSHDIVLSTPRHERGSNSQSFYSLNREVQDIPLISTKRITTSHLKPFNIKKNTSYSFTNQEPGFKTDT